MFVEEETGDLLFQGWSVADPVVLAEVDGHSRIADDESDAFRQQADVAVFAARNREKGSGKVAMDDNQSKAEARPDAGARSRSVAVSFAPDLCNRNQG